MGRIPEGGGKGVRGENTNLHGSRRGPLPAIRSVLEKLLANPHRLEAIIFDRVRSSQGFNNLALFMTKTEEQKDPHHNVYQQLKRSLGEDAQCVVVEIRCDEKPVRAEGDFSKMVAEQVQRQLSARDVLKFIKLGEMGGDHARDLLGDADTYLHGQGKKLAFILYRPEETQSDDSQLKAEICTYLRGLCCEALHATCYLVADPEKIYSQIDSELGSSLLNIFVSFYVAGKDYGDYDPARSSRLVRAALAVFQALGKHRVVNLMGERRIGKSTLFDALSQLDASIMVLDAHATFSLEPYHYEVPQGKIVMVDEAEMLFAKPPIRRKFEKELLQNGNAIIYASGENPLLPNPKQRIKI